MIPVKTKNKIDMDLNIMNRDYINHTHVVASQVLREINPNTRPKMFISDGIIIIPSLDVSIDVFELDLANISIIDAIKTEIASQSNDVEWRKNYGRSEFIKMVETRLRLMLLLHKSRTLNLIS